jgi:septum formation protein
MKKIVLASSSERRAQLLKQIGLVNFIIDPSNIEEVMDENISPSELVQKLALEKAKDVAARYPDAIIIGADTFIVQGKKYLGKPKDTADAKKILSSFSGKSHKALSGFALIDTKEGKIITGYDVAKVFFRKLTEKEIDDYITTGEPLDKAGAYGYMHRGAVLIEKVEGDFYSVIGLPIAKIHVELKKLGVNSLVN